MKYDDVSWHSGGDFPNDLVPEAGATHTGMFLAWAILAGLGGGFHHSEFPKHAEMLRRRSVAPGAFFLEYCDGKLTDEDLNAEGNAFAAHYYAFDQTLFIKDYECIVGQGLTSLYHAADSWENFDLLKPLLDKRYEEWKAAPPPAPIRDARQLQTILHDGICGVIEGCGFRAARSSNTYSKKLGNGLIQRFSFLLRSTHSGFDISSLVGFAHPAINAICAEAGIPGAAKNGNTYSYGIGYLFGSDQRYCISSHDDISLAIQGLINDFEKRASLCFSEIHSLETLERLLNSREGRDRGSMTIKRAASGLVAAWLLDRAQAPSVYAAHCDLLCQHQQNLMAPYVKLYAMLQSK
jgi:hypothetical protein